MDFRSLITNGRLHPPVALALQRTLQGMEGKVVDIVVKERKSKRSVQQNRFWFGVCVPLLTELFRSFGNDVDDEETHLFAKEHIWRWTKTIVAPNGTRAIIIRSSKELNKAEWEEMLAKTRAWAAEHNVEIPFPNEDNQPPTEAYNGR